MPADETCEREYPRPRGRFAGPVLEFASPLPRRRIPHPFRRLLRIPLIGAKSSSVRSERKRPLSAFVAIVATVVMLALVTSMMSDGRRRGEGGLGMAGDGPEAAAAIVPGSDS